MLLNKQVKGKN